MATRIRLLEDPQQCAALWTRSYGRTSLFDPWEARACFHRAFQRPLCFVVAEAGDQIAGLLPLAWVAESQSWAFFPGETWHGDTWIEGNRILADSADILLALIEAAPGPVDLRYLAAECLTGDLPQARIDELNYRFIPRNCGYCYEAYLARFSSKARKKIFREVDGLAERGVTYRIDDRRDIDRMFAMNIQNYGDQSYFSDPRFLAGFLALTDWFRAQRALRMTTVLIGGEVAAIDMGVVWGDCYTLLAGATSREFPGVAKFINLHHIERSCNERFETVDFLCGDFGWKERFQLVPMPLYRVGAGAPVVARAEVGAS